MTNVKNINGENLLIKYIMACYRSNKLKPFWHSINDPVPVLENLSSALLSAEYEFTLARALAMPECPVVPFFGAFLRELREVIASESKVNH